MYIRWGCVRLASYDAINACFKGVNIELEKPGHGFQVQCMHLEITMISNRKGKLTRCLA